MQIDKTSFGPWRDAWRLTIGRMEMIVVAEVGPRILSFRHGDGPNVLFDDSQGSLARGEWKIYGGHRLWIAPETEATYHPDNATVAARVEGGRLILTASPEAGGLQKTLEIGPCPTRGDFAVVHRVVNQGPMLVTGAIWALTCVEPKGRIVAQWGEGSAGWRTQMIRYWQGWGGHGSQVASGQWSQRDGHFVVEPTGEEGKVGLFADTGVIALLRADATFRKQAAVLPHATYPDGGCNIEIYTGDRFCEMETLGPLVTFLPGEETRHVENWSISDRTFQPEEWRQVVDLGV